MTTLAIFALLVALLVLGLPVAAAMGLTAVIGLAALGDLSLLTIVGQRVSFSIDFGVILNFVGDLNAAFTSITGTFTGTNCNVPPVVVIPSGSWNGTKR